MFINIFIIGIIFSIISFTNSQEHNLIEIDKIYNGTMIEDDSFRFFKLVIPKGIQKDVSNLVFKVEEPAAAREGRDDFSDPDIFVSTVKIYFNLKFYLFLFIKRPINTLNIQMIQNIFQSNLERIPYQFLNQKYFPIKYFMLQYGVNINANTHFLRSLAKNF
jgi:hypothetical protein